MPHSPHRTGQTLAPDRIGNFDLLRLVFALSVVYMHSARLVDGGNQREFVQRLFGIEAPMGYGSGDLAVNGFFAISGFFIAGTWRRSGSVGSYFRNRAARIYPGFVVASLLSQAAAILAAGKAALAWLGEVPLGTRLLELVLLAYPTAHFPFHAGRLHAQDLPPVNVPLWVVSHQARCYILAALVGILAVRFGAKWWARGWTIVLVGTLSMIATGVEIPRFPGYTFVIGWQTYLLRYIACFAVGALFQQFQERMIRMRWALPLTTIALVVCLAHEAWLPLALPTLLAVVVLQLGTSPALSRVLPRIRLDLSFGIFLYAWPVQILLVHAFPELGLLGLFLLSGAVAAGCAWASLLLVERPFLRWKKAIPSGVRAP